MTDVLVYSPDYRQNTPTAKGCRWHSNHRVFRDLLLGDRLWVITSGRSLGLENESAGYVVGAWPVTAVTKNPGDDPEYPSRKYQYRVLVNESEAIHLDEPVDVDHVIRGEGYDAQIPVGRFLRGPRRLTDAKVRLLRSAAGAEMARKWLTASNRRDDNGVASFATSEEQGKTQ